MYLSENRMLFYHCQFYEYFSMSKSYIFDCISIEFDLFIRKVEA